MTDEPDLYWNEDDERYHWRCPRCLRDGRASTEDGAKEDGRAHMEDCTVPPRVVDDPLNRAIHWLVAQAGNPHAEWGKAAILLGEFDRLKKTIREKDALIADLAAKLVAK